MNEAAPKCSCVVDTSGLHAIAAASGNLQSILIEKLASGTIGVPACAWQEFDELYEEEAAILAPHISNKIIMKKSTYVGAARIAEKLNSGFPRGAYDNHTELYTASIASNNGHRVLTSSDQVAQYARMDCDAVDIETWVQELPD
ncbi:hypothetical protein HAP41_0000028330 [Bradyrhizobium barranii subsp. apii]|uniref:Uncharacterized protein n=1 Tax=Bradyrhizobium barranii subsp. apii TaxID=2819348 RepID=A0A8T5VEH6_9BRAD|nr:hypothetical protein [Bradyrhizobium barranii]UPT84279.1 hypothetical protein HAP41_0000028330 [Bradyrhizobium barranii subsp. apii]UPU00348.1 hypothetical protein J4G48_0020995 [Bradyrhizobium barranii subsp. apii]